MGKGMIRFSDAAKHYEELPHQLAAWNYLQENVPPELLKEFAELYRSAPRVQPPPPWLSPAMTFVKQWEGFSPEPYRDAAQVLTLGYGETQLNGRAVRDGDRITKPEAEVLLSRRLIKDYGAALFRLVPMAATWPPAQVAALVSFVYNVGVGALESSTLRRRLNAGEPPASVVAEELPKWNKAAGKPLQGLTNRRKAEVELFLSATPPASVTGVLKVPYYSQRDSGFAGQAQRMCFSSSCAMLLSYLRPGAIVGPNADDKYLATLRQYGDTTDPNAQLKTLASYGVTAKFIKTANWEVLRRQITRKVPVPCGFLHHGSSSSPTGGGHWLTVIGVDDSAAIVHDPWGEMNVQLGTYRNSNGASLRYPRANWEPRWCVEGAATGWSIIAEP